MREHATVGQARAWRTPMLLKVATEGKHFAVNALGVLAVAHALGADRARTLCGLAEWQPPAGRGTREELVLDAGQDGASIELIDDAFNANPASLSAALAVLAATEPRHGVGRVSRGRRVAILGDMLELGPQDMALHAGMAADPAMPAISTVHCVGPRMRALWDALPQAQRGRWVAQADDLLADVAKLADAGDVVLVKGSKGSHVSRVVDAIRKLGHRSTSRIQEA